MSPERLYEDERYRLTLFRGRGDGRRLAVGFEHGRKDADEFMPASFPRYAQRLGIDALIVQTRPIAGNMRRVAARTCAAVTARTRGR